MKEGYCQVAVIVQPNLEQQPPYSLSSCDCNTSNIFFDENCKYYNFSITHSYDKSCLQRTKVDLTPGERACAASHLGIWQRHVKGELEPFISSKDDVVLILEDDALLGDGFIHNVMSLLENLPKTFDICLLGYR